MVICDRVNAANPFDIASFVENINYVYLVGAMQIWKLVYLVAGIGIPMSLSIVFKEKVNLPINLHRNN